MSKNLIHCYEKLKFISEIKDEKLRKKLLNRVGDNCLYNALHEIAINTLKGRIPLNSNQKRKLNKQKKLLINLSKNTKDNIRKKKLVKQSGGALLPIIIPAIASIISSLISK